jgi:hypothetical protein
MKKMTVIISGLTWLIVELAHLLHMEAAQPHTESERPTMQPKPAFKVAGRGVGGSACGIGRIDLSVSLVGISG